MKKIAIFFLFFLPLYLYPSHSVILKSGSTIRGQVVAQNETGVTVKTEDGKTVTIEKYKILRVVYKDVTAEEEARIRREEERKLKAQEEALRKKEEEAEKKRLEEEARIRAQEEKKQKEAERIAEEKRKARLERIAREGTRSEWDIVWRSAVLPGFGLLYAERKVAGSIYTTLFWGGLLYSFRARSRALSAKSEYDTTVLFYQIARPNPIDYITADGINVQGFFLRDQLLSQTVSDTKKEYIRSTNQYNGSLGFLVLVYFTQILHSYFSGREWVLEEFDEAYNREGFKIVSYQEYAGGGNEYRTETRYQWSF